MLMVYSVDCHFFKRNINFPENLLTKFSAAPEGHVFILCQVWVTDTVLKLVTEK